MTSSLINPKYGLSALALEVGAWSGVWLFGVHSDAALLGYLTLHAASSALLSLALLPLIPRRFAPSRAATFALMVACCYAIPILGFLGVMAAFPVLLRFRGRVDMREFESLELPEFDPQQHLQREVRAAGVGAFLLDERVPVAKRERAMAALQSIAEIKATPVLRRMLRSSSEDLRLLAYGMLNRLETRIARAIDNQRGRLEAAKPGGREALRSARNLSDLHWELVASGLAQEDLRTHALGESLAYCEQVLEVRPDDGPMQVRRARLLHEVGDLDGAEGNYRLARALRMPPQRVLPHLARLHFERREFARIQPVVADFKRWRALPRLRRVIDYWERAT